MLQDPDVQGDEVADVDEGVPADAGGDGVCGFAGGGEDVPDGEEGGV